MSKSTDVLIEVSSLIFVGAVTTDFDRSPETNVFVTPSMRRLLVAVGTAVSTLVASCGPSQEQWKSYGQCMSDTSDKVECARKNDIDEKMVD